MLMLTHLAGHTAYIRVAGFLFALNLLYQECSPQTGPCFLPIGRSRRNALADFVLPENLCINGRNFSTVNQVMAFPKDESITAEIQYWLRENCESREPDQQRTKYVNIVQYSTNKIHTVKWLASVKLGINGMESVELDAGIKYIEPPFDVGFSLVQLQFQGMNLPTEGFLVGKTLPGTTEEEDTELDLNHIQPTPVLGGPMKLQPPFNAPRLRGGKGLVHLCWAMGFKLSSTRRTTGTWG